MQRGHGFGIRIGRKRMRRRGRRRRCVGDRTHTRQHFGQQQGGHHPKGGDDVVHHHGTGVQAALFDHLVVQGHRVEVDASAHVGAGKHARDGVVEAAEACLPADDVHAHQHADHRAQRPDAEHGQHRETGSPQVAQVHFQQQVEDADGRDVREDGFVQW